MENSLTQRMDDLFVLFRTPGDRLRPIHVRGALCSTLLRLKTTSVVPLRWLRLPRDDLNSNQQGKARHTQ